MNRFGRTSAFVWLGALMLLAALVAVATLQLERQRDQALLRAETVASEAARAAESSLNRALLRIDSLLVSLPRLLATLGSSEPPDSAAFTEIIRQLNQQSFLTRDVRIHAADGTYLVGARPTPRQRRPHLEPEFLYRMREEREVGLRFDKPTRDHLTGEWSIIIGRRIDLPTHEAAIAVAELPLDALADLVTAPSAGLPVLLTLRRPDGTVLATAPHRESMIGRPLAPIEPRSATGVARAGAGDVPGQQAIAAARQVSHRPLVLRAAIDEEDALAGWTADVDATVLLLGGVAVLLVAGAGTVTLAMRRRHRSEAEIIDARRSLQEAIDSMSDGFILFDRDQRLVTCNRRYLEIFPHLATVARPGAPITALAEVGARRAVPGATREQIDAWVRWRLQEDSEGREIEQHVNGRVIHTLEWRTAAGGRAWTVRDVTESKRAEAALVAAKAEADAVGRIRSGFLANMGRQLRAPLEAILRTAEQLREAREPGRAEDILRHGRQLRALIEEVLDLARVEAGGYRPIARRFALKPLIHFCTGLAAKQSGAGAFDLEVQAEDAIVCTDETALRRIVLTLLANAIRMSSTARIGIEAKVTRSGMIQLRIADAGVGAPGAGGRVTGADGVAAGGTSAVDDGLASVASCIAALNGQIEIDSSVERGNAIVLLLPQSAVEAEPEPEASTQPQALTPARELRRSA